MEMLQTALAAAPDAHWRAGWILILSGFGTGALLGLRFHEEGMAGGYGSFRRRTMRLGHVALVALGMLQLLVSAGPPEARSVASSAMLLAGSVAMPAVCFLTAWRPGLRRLFPLPVLLLAGAAALILGGSP